MNYIEVHIDCKKDLKEIIIAELDFIQADSISELDTGLFASFTETLFKKNNLEKLASTYNFKYTFNKSEKINWNKEWEKNFPQLIIENCSIRASFHIKPDHVNYDIVINPKMSFGTGHHETTTLMVTKLLKMNLEGKPVLDMGTGTGILAILAEKRGAKSIIGIDIDDWSIENAIENVTQNNCQNIKIVKGNAKKLNDFGNFEVVIANINRNILLEDMCYYINHLSEKGRILFSGFYSEDVVLIKNKANSLGLELSDSLGKNNWMMLEFLKKIKR